MLSENEIPKESLKLAASELSLPTRVQQMLGANRNGCVTKI